MSNSGIDWDKSYWLSKQEVITLGIRDISVLERERPE